MYPRNFLNVTLLTLMSPALMYLVLSFDPPCKMSYSPCPDIEHVFESKMMVKQSCRSRGAGVVSRNVWNEGAVA